MKRSAQILVLLICAAVAALWGVSLERNAGPVGRIDFKGLYYGTQCLLNQCDPYNERALEAFYFAHGGQPISGSAHGLEIITLFVNLPTVFLFITPLAFLPWGIAHVVWMVLAIGSLTIAGLLTWSQACDDSAGVATLLVGIALIDCEVVIAGGNAAALVVSGGVIAVWCFVRARLELVGVAALAISLVIKPHDTGFIWLYFLIAGGAYRKRALQTLGLTVALALSALLWMQFAAPHWWSELRSNMAVISAPGGLNDLSPASVTAHTAGMVVNLEPALQFFSTNPRVYGAATYLICGTLLATWLVAVLRASKSPAMTWLALASIVPLTMLITYHRPYDARLLLLAVPACAMLWTEGGPTAWLALFLTGGAIVFTGDIFLAIFLELTAKVRIESSGAFGRTLTAALERPASFALLSMAIFYLWVYARRVRGAGGTAETGCGQEILSPTSPELPASR